MFSSVANAWRPLIVCLSIGIPSFFLLKALVCSACPGSWTGKFESRGGALRTSESNLSRRVSKMALSIKDSMLIAIRV